MQTKTNFFTKSSFKFLFRLFKFSFDISMSGGIKISLLRVSYYFDELLLTAKATIFCANPPLTKVNTHEKPKSVYF